MYADPRTVVHIECDERQHRFNNGSYHCDEKRISDIYNEFPGKRYIVIRWNPDGYKPLSGQRKLNFKERLHELKQVFDMIMSGQWSPKSLIHCIFMFYDSDSDRITQNIPHTLIGRASDLK